MASDSEIQPDDLRAIGFVVGVHGLAGTLKVFSLSDFPERFDHLHTVYFRRDGQVIAADEVRQVRWMGDVLLMTVREVTSRAGAESLRNAEVCVTEDEAVRLPADVFFESDLVGYDVVGDDGTRLGVVEGFLKGAHDIVQARGDFGELLVPFVGEWIGRVDTSARTIEVLDWRRLIDAETVDGSLPDDH